MHLNRAGGPRFEQAYTAATKHLRVPGQPFYANVAMESGALANHWVDALAAFWPGLQVPARPSVLAPRCVGGTDVQLCSAGHGTHVHARIQRHRMWLWMLL